MWYFNKVIYEMQLWANAIGDKSWMKYFDCDDFLTMKAVTYHESKEVKKKRPAKPRVTKKKVSKKQ